MKNDSRTAKAAPMNPDAFAGFLKLWVTPVGKLPAAAPDVEAYLRYANEREPLSPASRRALGQPTDRAA